MKTLLLKRVVSGDKGTYGTLVEGDIPICLTLEDPWRGNMENVSCIPAGTYRCERVTSPKFGDVFKVLDVPGRSHVLLHKGNTIEDTIGCILIGGSYGNIEGTWGIRQSASTFTEFMKRLEGVDEFTLCITEAY
jgi:hypothetical protein